VPLSSYGKPFKAEAGTVDAALDMKTAVRSRSTPWTARLLQALCGAPEDQSAHG